MHKNKKFYAILLCVVMVLSMFGSAISTFADDEDPGNASDAGNSWVGSLSKTVSDAVLTEEGNYETDVTLSLPSADEQLASDVVFIIDRSGSTKDCRNEIKELLGSLNGVLTSSSAKVKVAIIVFSGTAFTYGWYDLETEQESIMTAIDTYPDSTGSNLSCGLIAAKQILDADTEVASQRKHVVLIGDAITYVFGAEGKVVGWTYPNVPGEALHCTVDVDSNWRSKYGTKDAPDDWNSYLNTIGEQISAIGDQYDRTYDGVSVPRFDSVSHSEADDYTQVPNSVDKALYYSWEAYTGLVSSGYNVSSIMFRQYDTYPWASSFMLDVLHALYAPDKDTAETILQNVKNEIYSAIGSQSYVTDIIGKGTDDQGKEYDFEFIPDASTMTINENGTSYTAEQTGVNEFTFENGSVVTYYPDGTRENPDEHFVWNLSTVTDNFNRISLTYRVRLTNPQDKQDEEITYGALITNVSAMLTPVDSNGIEGNLAPFPIPTVQYTIPANVYYDLTVNYVDEDGNVLKEAKETPHLLEGTSFTEEAAAIAEYELVGLTINEAEKELAAKVEGSMTSDMEITYIYRAIPKYVLKVNYVDEAGKALKESKSGTFLSGTAYSEDAAEIADYELTALKIDAKDAELAKNVAGNLSADIEITFIYKVVEESSEESSVPTPPVRPVTPEQSVEGAVDESSTTSTPTEEKPVSDKPNTGDQSNVTFWVMGMLISAAGIALVAKKTRRTDK